MPVQIHQFHPTVAYGDAISTQILNLQHVLRQLGYQSEIFCRQRPLLFDGKVREIQNYERYSATENLLILHYSLGYPLDVWSWLRNLPDRKVICYHNITPHHYFSGINETFYDAAFQGRRELVRLLPLTESGWGDSSYNVGELIKYGWENTKVLPIIFDDTRYAVKPDKKILSNYMGKPNILYVSRLSPNKKPDDIILAFYYLKQIRPDAQLIIVGSAGGMDLYQEYLMELVKQLNLNDVVFTGHVSTSELVAYYQTAKILMSMSEHEGFGVPFLEAMYFKVPIVAYKTGAVAETLGGSGAMFTQKNFLALAIFLDVLLKDKDLRNTILTRQQRQLQRFYPNQVKIRLLNALQDINIR